ncbi:Two pore calcium channel protein 1 [Linum perenne]
MESPMLGETSEPSSIHSDHVFRRRADAIAYGSNLQRAAALVDLAEDGVGLPEQILDNSSFGAAAKSYFVFIKFEFIWTLNYFALVLLNFLEKPLWCANCTSDCCQDRDYFYLGQLPFLNSMETLIYEVVCLAILVADLLVYGLYLSPVAFSVLPFRIAPYIRVIFFILSISWVAYVMFEDTEQGKTVFTSYAVTLYQLFILFTTSNNPDVWIPAYKESRWYSLFFVIYVLLGVYFVTNLVLAVVYDSFKNQLVKQVAEADNMRKRTLMKAFNLIDRYINLDEFADLCHAIALRFHKEDVKSYFEYFPSVYHAPFSERLKTFVRRPIFGYIISFILVINLVAVIIETTLDIADNSGQKAWQVVEFVFGWIYVLEMALKVYSYGFANYWRDGQNRFDFLVTLVIVIGETMTFVTPDAQTFFSNGEWIRYLLLARMLRLLRLLMYVRSYQAFLATFLTLIPSLMPYLGMIFCIMCMYCSLGVQVFGGIVNAGNPNLNGTDLAENDYLLFNFNDYPNGMVTLFNLLVLGNWQAWMQSYTELTDNRWTVAYFVSFYLITVLLLLNLVVAFVLEAFFAEMELESSEENEDPSNTKPRSRYMGTKTRSQRVDVLLHHMLSSELNKTSEC